MSKEDIFRVQRNCLRLVGHRFDAFAASTSNDELPPMAWWRKIIQIGTLVLVVSAQFPMLHYCFDNIDNITLATRSLSIAFTNGLTVVKIIVILYNRKEFDQLMKSLNFMYHAINDPTAKNYLKTTNRYCIYLVRIYLYSCALTGLYFHCQPLMKIVWCRLIDTDIVLNLPMPMIFPFDYLHSPGYQVAYIYTFLVTFTVVMYASAVDNLFLAYAFNLCAHFKALQHFIRSNSYVLASADQHRCISTYIQYHNMLLRMSHQLGIIYGPVVFCEFLLVSLLLCVILYQMVTNISSVFSLIMYGTFLSSIMLQLLIYCYGGEILRSESLKVSTAIQLSDWYNLTPSNRRMFLLAMQRSQKEVIIKSGFYVASLENYMMIVKTAVSYITIIQSIE